MSFIRDLIVRIKGDKSQLDATLKGAEGSISKFGSVVSRLGGVMAGLFSITAIVSFGKAVIGASEGLSDKFSFAVAGAKGAAHEFFNRIGTGDFSGFIKGLTDSYGKAKQLAEALDELKDKRAYVDYVTSGKKQESAIQESIVKDKTGQFSLERRKKAAEDLKAIEREILDITNKALQDQFKLESQGWENKNKMTIEKGKQVYETVTNMSEATQKRLQEIFAKADELYKGKDIFGSKKKYITQQAGVISDEAVQAYRDYLELMKSGEEDVIPKLFGIFQSTNEGMVAAQERFNGVLRITNTLLEEQQGTISLVGKAVATPYSFTGGKIDKGKGANELRDAPVTSLTNDDKIKIAQLNDELAAEMTEMEEILTSGRDMAVDLGMQLVEGIGEAFAGGNVKDIGKSLLMAFANFLSQFGKMLITAGLAGEAFKKLTQTGQGIPAIIAGTAMLLAAGAVRGAMSSGSLTGGGSSGGGGGYSSGQSSMGNMKIQIEGVLKGKDIFWSAKRYVEDNE